METGKPEAKSDMNCPFFKQPMNKVCHKCALFIKIQGKNPNTGQDIDAWDCSFSWLPLLMIENTQQGRAVGAAMESWRNEFVKAEQTKLQVALPYLQQGAKRLERLNEGNDN